MYFNDIRICLHFGLLWFVSVKYFDISLVQNPERKQTVSLWLQNGIWYSKEQQQKKRKRHIVWSDILWKPNVLCEILKTTLQKFDVKNYLGMSDEHLMRQIPHPVFKKFKNYIGKNKISQIFSWSQSTVTSLERLSDK